MDEHGLARGIGWLSIAVGLVLVLAPERGTSGFGMGERKRLGFFLGAKDLVIGAGLLHSADARPWLLARAASDTQDAALLADGVGLCASSFVLARCLG